MVISCSAFKCKNRQNSIGSNGNKVSFHRFPKDKDLCDAWLVASQRLDFVPTKYSYLCSDHFTDDQFNRTKKINSSRLKSNAIPSIFTEFPIVKKKAPSKISLKQATKIQPTVKIAPKQTSIVHPTVKIAPKQASVVQPTVQIAPKPIFDVQAPIRIIPNPVVSDVVSLAPSPVITDLTSIADTVVSSNIIEAALNAYKQTTNSTMSNHPNGTPVSIYVVHPQPNGSNIVTVPSVLGMPSSALGTISATTSSSQSLENKFKKTPYENKQKVKIYEERIKRYRRNIKILQQQNHRQAEKIEKLKSIVKDLRNQNVIDEEEEEEDVSEDMSEDEIYEELLKNQQESTNEDDDVEDCEI